jgi:hypothetical protein
MSESEVPILRDQLNLATWLYIGALFQALLFLVYPSRLIATPVLILMFYKIFRTGLLWLGVVVDKRRSKVRFGRMTAQIVEEDGSLPKNGTNKEIVVFILGASSNKYVLENFIDVRLLCPLTSPLRSPVLGSLDPEFNEAGNMFIAMLEDMAVNGGKWGCKTPEN